jgi:hypothetical protein
MLLLIFLFPLLLLLLHVFLLLLTGRLLTIVDIVSVSLLSKQQKLGSGTESQLCVNTSCACLQIVSIIRALDE